MTRAINDHRCFSDDQSDVILLLIKQLRGYIYIPLQYMCKCALLCDFVISIIRVIILVMHRLDLSYTSLASFTQRVIHVNAINVLMKTRFSSCICCVLENTLPYNHIVYN